MVTTEKFFYVDPLPLLEKEPEWNLFFQPRPYSLPRRLEPAEQMLLEEMEGRWLMAFHWVLKKKWLSKHKIPFRKQIGNLYEPEGEFWYRILELCIQCHSSKWGRLYANASAWYSWLVFEEKHPFLVQIISENSETEETSQENKHGMKAEYIKEEQRISGALRNWNNPFHPQLNPHQYHLIQASLEMANVSDCFRKKYWNTFKQAYSKRIASIATRDFGWVWIETKNNEQKTKVIVQQKGQGKHKQIQSLPPTESEFWEHYYFANNEKATG